MTKDQVRFRLGGEITIGTLSDALSRFSQVLDALREDHNVEVQWVLAGLDYGSARALARAVPLNDEAEQRIPAMCENYVEVARRVRQGNVDRVSALDRRMSELLKLADESHHVVIESGSERLVVETPVASLTATEPDVAALGTVRGRIETLSRRKKLSFNLYELTTDSAIQCYLEPGLEDTMRDVWGHVADVTGMISRDANTDTPLSVRAVTKVDRVDEGDPDGYLRARGAFRSDLPAEVLVRSMRDEE